MNPLYYGLKNRLLTDPGGVETMNVKRYDAAILDMDGVVTQTATLHAQAWKRMFDTYLQGRDVEPFDSYADYRAYVDGKPRYDGVRSFLQARGIDLPEGEPNDPPERETICGLGNLKNEVVEEFGCSTY
jgi:trehalose 6-phosphate phosphatase